MSARVSGMVWERSEHKAGALVVLLAIADNANDNGLAWPSLDHLAAKTRMTGRGVQYALKQLIDSGELALVRQGRKGRGTNVYQVCTKTLRGKSWVGDAGSLRTQIEALSEPDRTKTETHRTKTTTTQDENDDKKHVADFVQNRHRTVIEPSNEPSTPSVAGATVRVGGKKVNSESWALTQQVLAAFNSLAGRDMRALTSGGVMSQAASYIYKRIREYPDLSLEDFERIIANTIASRWWSEGQDDGEKPSFNVIFGPKVFEGNIARKGHRRGKGEPPTVGRSREQRQRERWEAFLELEGASNESS